MLLLAIIALAGCSSDETGRVLTAGEVNVLVATAPVADDSAGVGVGGALTVVGACLGIEGTTVVWPEGTTVVEASPITIDVPGVGEVSLGDRLSG